MSYNSLAVEIHESNVKAGWWSDPKTGERKQRNVGELLMLVVSEVCEGAEGFQMDFMDDKLPQYPMLAVELADTAIRLYDICGFYNVDIDAIMQELGDYASVDHEMSTENQLLMIVRHIANAMEGNRKNSNHDIWPERKRFDIGLVMALRDVYKVADQFAWNLAEIIDAKRDFNAHREDHKVENRLKEGGKAY